MSDTSLENRINFLRLLLIIGLVFLHYGSFPGSDHSPFRGYGETDTPIATFINSYFLFLFFSAVPVLSAISGYLFFKGMEPHPGFYMKRYRSRFRSILLPMISWDAFVILIFMGIHIAAPGSPVQSIIQYDMSNLGVGSTVNALLGITRHPINFQFWFLRDLLLTVLCTPLLAIMMRKAPFLGLLIIGTAWLVDYDFEIFFRADVLLFFYLGGLIRLQKWNLDFISPRTALVLMSVYVVLIALRTIAPAYIDSGSLTGEFILGPGTRLLRILGVMAFWGCAPFLMKTFWGRRITAYGSIAFFLHSVHWPLNQFIKAGLATILPAGGDLALLVNYFVTIVLTLAATFIIARILTAIAPGLFSHLSGGRSIDWSAAHAASTAGSPQTSGVIPVRNPVAGG